jgi:peptidoglycan LD-endopeptidase LytH
VVKHSLPSVLSTALLCALSLGAEPIAFPTANHALLEKGAEDRFFVGTVGKPWTTGTFGCVRSEGHQMHEGLDIRCLQRDRRGEPEDPVLATAGGTVAYLSARPALSNYGKYIILRHQLDGLEVFSLYAHLSAIQPGLAPGQPVKAGDRIGTMGRTANTHEGISKDRAHVHFEINLLVNDQFEAWYKRRFPDQRNDHGRWNGQNLLGIDPRPLLEGQGSVDLAQFIRGQAELCRVSVRKTDFPWLRRYAALVRKNPKAEKEGLAGYELALNFNGVPFEIIPRAASELKGNSKVQLLSVSEAELKRNPARRLISRKGNRFQLTNHGLDLLDLLTY